MQTRQVDEQVLNDLYWRSDRTIAEIVADTGVSRNGLYSAIKPFDTRKECSACGGELFFPNRSSQNSGKAACSSCGRVQNVSEESVRRGSVVYDGEPSERGWSRWREEFAAVPRDRAALIGGAAALGVMLGAAAFRAIRH